MKQLVEVDPPRRIIVKLGPKTWKVARLTDERWISDEEPTHVAIYEPIGGGFRREYLAASSLAPVKAKQGGKDGD